jgi:hypothetical protein
MVSESTLIGNVANKQSFRCERGTVSLVGRRLNINDGTSSFFNLFGLFFFRQSFHPYFPVNFTHGDYAWNSPPFLCKMYSAGKRTLDTYRGGEEVCGKCPNSYSYAFGYDRIIHFIPFIALLADQFSTLHHGGWRQARP